MTRCRTNFVVNFNIRPPRLNTFDLSTKLCLAGAPMYLSLLALFLVAIVVLCCCNNAQRFAAQAHVPVPIFI